MTLKSIQPPNHTASPPQLDIIGAISPETESTVTSSSSSNSNPPNIGDDNDENVNSSFSSQHHETSGKTIKSVDTSATTNDNNGSGKKIMSVDDNDDTTTNNNNNNGPEGCYLVYEANSSGRLMIQYSKGPVPDFAVGFFCPGDGKCIQGFKFKRHGGRSELIKGIAGGDSNRRKYFVGWCQFIKLAKQMSGKIIKFPNAVQGVEVDIYGYRQVDSHPYFLDVEEALIDVRGFDAIAVMPKHHEFLRGVKTIGVTRFLELGSIAGASTTMQA